MQNFLPKCENNSRAQILFYGLVAIGHPPENLCNIKYLTEIHKQKELDNLFCNETPLDSSISRLLFTIVSQTKIEKKVPEKKKNKVKVKKYNMNNLNLNIINQSYDKNVVEQPILFFNMGEVEHCIIDEGFMPVPVYAYKQCLRSVEKYVSLLFALTITPTYLNVFGFQYDLNICFYFVHCFCVPDNKGKKIFSRYIYSSRNIYTKS